jgi:cell pole-organizing protein PopZ
MSASHPASPGAPAAPGGAAPGGADPSMEDILASIRRILSDDEPADTPPAAADPPHAPAAPAPVSAAPPPSVAPPPARSMAPLPPPAESLPPGDEDVLSLDASMLVKEPRPAPPAPSPRPDVASVFATPSGLVAPEAAAAAASSVGSLVRTLIAGREQVSVHRGGPTIEDVVREELRPILKLWLDTNLPPLVERLVQAEIERVVSRTSA